MKQYKKERKIMTKKRIMKEYRIFVEQNGASAETVNRFVLMKRAKKANMHKVIPAMAAYADSTGNEILTSELLWLGDGGCGACMENLSKTTKAMYGTEVWEKIFGDVEMPKMGWTLPELSEFTHDIEQRYLSATTRENYERAQKCGNPNVRTYEESERKILSLEEIDTLIANENARIHGVLHEHFKSRDLFYGQNISDAVMADYETGRFHIRREGNKILLFQIPYLWHKFLTETDETMKRYYACHCCWARKSILSDKPVSMSFCLCSLGHSKRWLDDALGRQLDGRVLCSALDGSSTRCVFEVDIPDDICEKRI